MSPLQAKAPKEQDSLYSKPGVLSLSATPSLIPKSHMSSKLSSPTQDWDPGSWGK